MKESGEERAKRYDAIGSAVVTYGPLVAVLFGVGRWLVSLWMEGGYISVASLAFIGLSFGLAVLWIFFRLKRKRPNV
jgi:hypothetical protein